MDAVFNLPNEPTIEFLRNHWNDDPATLLLQSDRYPDVDMAWVAQQVKGRKKAKEKIPSWYENGAIAYPISISMEQCSSEATAKYKADICSGSTLVDLTGGLGVDTAFMSKNFTDVTYVERNEELVALAWYNFSQLRLANINTENRDAIEVLYSEGEVDWLYIDPARRKENQQKAVLLSDCEPDILEHQARLLQKAKNVLIKLSPLFDITALSRLFPNAGEIHIVSVNNECKELLLRLDREEHISPQIICVNILKEGERQRFEFTLANEVKSGVSVAANPLAYLYEPNASIQKSGGFKSFAHQFGLEILHSNTRLYMSVNRIENFQGRSFIVESVFGFSKQELKASLSDIKKANITVRNFPLSVAELRKKLGLQDGGVVYLFAITLSSGKNALIRCRKDS
ncbi:MAG: class I SAM-dependent methyltransferase [Prevotellaceae bacterium]|nr:class I SAM-dependent methyltransferase [Prevotellaceae bacterium]